MYNRRRQPREENRVKGAENTEYVDTGIQVIWYENLKEPIWTVIVRPKPMSKSYVN